MNYLLTLLEHGHLVLAYRHRSSLKRCNIGSLADRICKETYRNTGLKISHLDLRFNGRISLQT